MIVINLDKEKEYQLPPDCSLCLGMFDGVHVGHQRLFAKGKNSNSLVAVLTFTSSPKFVLNNRLNSSLITPVNKRVEVLEKLGVDIVLLKDFTLEFASMTSESFIDNFLKVLNPSCLVVGFDYRFGQYGKGNIELLKKHFVAFEIASVNDENGKISSTRIIEGLNNGNIQDVNKCLGRTYEIEGKVVHGLKNGNTINFPTANILLKENYILPKDGVYIGLIKVNNKMLKAMINVGKHPTISELKESIIEVHIIDFNENIYDQDVQILFLDYLRDERSFSSLNDLKIELEKNRLTVLEYFKNK